MMNGRKFSFANRLNQCTRFENSCIPIPTQTSNCENHANRGTRPRELATTTATNGGPSVKTTALAQVPHNSIIEKAAIGHPDYIQHNAQRTTHNAQHNDLALA